MNMLIQLMLTSILLMNSITKPHFVTAKVSTSFLLLAHAYPSIFQETLNSSSIVFPYHSSLFIYPSHDASISTPPPTSNL